MAFFHFPLPVVCALLATVQLNRAEDTNGSTSLRYAMGAFSEDLNEKIRISTLDKNVLYSPASIYVALAMLYPGAGGKTKSQLASALHLRYFHSDDGKFYKSIKIFLQTLSSSKDYTLYMANRLFGQKGFNFKEEYIKITEEHFRAKLKDLDFRNDPSGSRSEINKWVAYMTWNKIEELFPQDAITNHTLLALANAVYFNSFWLHKFDKQHTKNQTFYLSNGHQIKVPMMNLLSPYLLGYHESETLACRILKLPYNGEKVCMLILLPNKVDGLSLLEERLTHNSTVKVFDSLKKVPVNVSLPKFIYQQSLNLKEPLKKLGMKNLFESADLSGIDGSDPLSLSESIHKAYISVSEDGTEAAAATGMSIKPVVSAFNKEPPISFIVDRPFVILIVEAATGAYLFCGGITNPLQSN